MGPYSRGVPGQLPSVKDGTVYNMHMVVYVGAPVYCFDRGPIVLLRLPCVYPGLTFEGDSGKEVSLWRLTSLSRWSKAKFVALSFWRVAHIITTNVINITVFWVFFFRIVLRGLDQKLILSILDELVYKLSVSNEIQVGALVGFL
jgi:hypothetical protein